MSTTEQRIADALDRFSFLSDVHVVGGAVRDAMIGRDSDDVDLATSDHPEAVMRKCRDRGLTVIETGVQHGTVTAVEDGLEVEITTFRKDVSTDGRNATVEWAETVEEDLRRRDFRINAMAARPTENGFKVVDPFGGLDDIACERIVAVGDARTRFREDFLRIVRALRFAARFGFEIGDEERVAMETLAGSVTDNVSVERIVMEVEKALKDDSPERFLSGLRELGILEDALEAPLPDLKAVFARTEKIRDPRLRMEFLVGALASRAGMGEDEIRSRLRLASDTARRGVRIHEAWTLAVSDPTFRPPWAQIREFQAEFLDVIDDVRAIKDQVFPGADVPMLREPHVQLEPVATGQDFVDRGFEEGPVIGELVDEAHRVQLREALTDRRELVDRAVQTVTEQQN